MLDPTELYEIADELPAGLDSPILLQALDGFVDAGQVRQLVHGHLLEASPAQVVVRFDDAVDTRLDGVRGRPKLDRLMYGASELGDWSLIWHLVGVSQALLPGRDPMTAVRLSAILGAESALVNVGMDVMASADWFGEPASGIVSGLLVISLLYLLLRLPFAAYGWAFRQSLTQNRVVQSVVLGARSLAAL